MSYPVVVVIIILTAVISYLIGIFDAKTTNKWFGADKAEKPTPDPIPIPYPNIKKLALVQTNDQNELFIEFEDDIDGHSYTIDKLNHQKLTQLVGVLNDLSIGTTPKASHRKEQPKPKEKLALQRSLVQAAQKAPAKTHGPVTDLIGLINIALDEENVSNGQVLEIREDQEHNLSFWVDEKGFSTVEEVEPVEARERFKSAIDSVNH